MPRRTPRPDSVHGESPEMMERRLARGRAYLAEKRKDPEWRAAKQAYLKTYQAKHYKDPEKKAARYAKIETWRKAHRAEQKKYWRTWYVNKRASLILASIKQRAKMRGWVFELDGFGPELQARIDAGYCELTGYPFNLSPADERYSRRFDGPSLDRIDSKKGYTRDNVRVVLNMVNYALNIWHEDELREVMTHWLMKDK